MPISLNHRSDYYRVTVNVDPDRSQALIDAALAAGACRVFIVRGRGVLHKRKVGFFSLPDLPPSYDILHLFIPGPHLHGVLGKLVAVGRLDWFGAGSLYATKIDDFWCSNTQLFLDEAPILPATDFEFRRDLVAIDCICQLEHAEEIARAAMEAGSPSPTICYGQGHGIRDRLGPFLQLTINPKKEFIELVVGADERDRIIDTMVEAGRLDRPARGFLFSRPVEVGLINTFSYHQSSPYPATMEQIIKAIDQMQGNTNWRSSGVVQAGGPRRKRLHNLVSLDCIVNRGFGDLCSLAAMGAGAGGTSSYFASAVPMERPAANAFDHSDERELITLTLAPELVEPVRNALASVPELQGTPLVLLTYPAPEAVTYLP